MPLPPRPRHPVPSLQGLRSARGALKGGALGIALAVSGCGGGGASLDLPEPDRERGVGTAAAVLGAPELAQIEEALGALDAGGASPTANDLRDRGSDAADLLRLHGLMPVHYGRYYLPVRGRAPVRVPSPPSGRPAEPAHVAGYLAGRHPALVSELVVVAADLQGPAGAAVLEVARLYADASRVAIVPERSLLFALWTPPVTTVEGAMAYLDAPTWSRGSIRAIVLVQPSGNLAPLRVRAESGGVALSTVTAANAERRPEDEAAELARRLLQRLRGLVRRDTASLAPPVTGLEGR